METSTKLTVTAPFITAGDWIKHAPGTDPSNGTYIVARITRPTADNPNYRFTLVDPDGYRIGTGLDFEAWEGARFEVVERGDAHDPQPRNQKLVGAWLDAKSVETEIAGRIRSAVRDRPPYGDPGYDAYQQDVMTPLIAERDAARAVVKFYHAAQHAARLTSANR